MDTDDFNKLYLIAYLISNSEDESIVGYSDLAARLIYLKNLIDREEKLGDPFIQEIRDLVVVDEDGSLDWSGLKDLIDRAESDDHGQMFLKVSSKSVGPQKWTYEFNCEAPEEILETKLDDLIESGNEIRFMEKVNSAAQVDDDELLEHVYQSS